ncbi:MAG: 3-isopropylmalate dehydratase [Phycisphaerae bacterium]|jgi:3-isopropylmalate/(R)-2-methylmalate dehydratase small subunit|nr:3-isopropylmalate dehydratase [Phycisphaerae bacterium]
MDTKISGKAFVLGDDIDTDQIIPAEYLSYNPSIEEERKMFGHYALSGVPKAQSGLPGGNTPFVNLADPHATQSEYTIVIGGKNFGCGSSREHAPLALAQAGVKAVVAQFYARIFFRNSVNGGYLVPLETDLELYKEIRTGDQVEIDLEKHQLTDQTTGKTYAIKPLGDVADIIEADGLFEYARKKQLT